MARRAVALEPTQNFQFFHSKDFFVAYLFLASELPLPQMRARLTLGFLCSISFNILEFFCFRYNFSFRMPSLVVLNKLRAATCKYHLQLCKIKKSKIPKLCHNKGFRYLITEIKY